ncbi:3-aminobutyryl-CoA ammonia lyase [Streptomyces sp. NPDC006476]|uniref:3-aminobutyryl-CoA ammonia lyase n=1 Tax=Streptomyces sp. NPDC006476 TaxID=3157175 RepID=UPI0033BAC9EC
MPTDLIDQCTAMLRVRIGAGEAHYGGDLVDGARMLRLFGDVVTEIAIRTDGDEGLLSHYTDVSFTAPVHAGDFIEVTGRMTEKSRLRRVVELEARKVIEARYEQGHTTAGVLDEPVVVCRALGVVVVPVHKARRRALTA